MKKLLLIKLSSLGDIIFNIPLANVLQKNGYEITWLVSEKGYDVIKDNPAVKNTILIPIQKWKKRGFSIANFCEFIKLAIEVRKEKYDIAIDSQGMFKSMQWMLLARAKRKLVFEHSREFSNLAGNETVQRAPNPDCTTNIIIQYMQFAKYLGLEGTDEIKYTLPPASEETKAKIDKLLQGLDKSKPMVVICPATTWKMKHWKKDNWKAVVDAIKDKCSLVFTGTERDNDLINYISGGNFINLAGKTRVKELIELFSRAALVMSPDSGSAHLARATEVPAVVTIFCCTPATMYGPLGNPEKYYSVRGNLNCKPCHKRNCPLTGPEARLCRTKPSADEIINIVNKILQNVKQ